VASAAVTLITTGQAPTPACCYCLVGHDASGGVPTAAPPIGPNGAAACYWRLWWRPVARYYNVVAAWRERDVVNVGVFRDAKRAVRFVVSGDVCHYD